MLSMAHINPGQWWNAPPDQRFIAYYLCLRVHYGMGALDAWNMAKRNFAAYPAFMSDPIGTLRSTLSKR